MKLEQSGRHSNPVPPPTALAVGSPAAIATAQPSGDREYLDDVATADYLKTTPRKLKELRLRGGGPRFVRLGQSCRYRRDWCDQWAEQNAVSSTSEETARRRK